ncbi:hypothetical protein GPK82_14465 [Coprococcus catus]|nr:hypothetical protein [Coprococcus catus]
MGFVYGAQSILSAAEYQFFGLLLCFFRLAPQIFFYLPALFLAWHLAGNPGYPFLSGKRRLFLISMLLWIVGTLSEWALNPYFLKFGIQLLL